VWDSLVTLLLHTDADGLSARIHEAAEELDADDARDAARQARRVPPWPPARASTRNRSPGAESRRHGPQSLRKRTESMRR
jgi:hypothetical protein